jgi:putative iron-dependent peroxidase
MSTPQSAILAPVPPLAHYLSLNLTPGANARAVLGALRGVADGERVAVGVGPSLALALGASIDGLRTFPSLAGARRAIPATPADLWIWLRGDDRGALYHLRRRVEAVLAPAFEVAQRIDAFRHGEGRDLTGYEDGTENPQGEDALEAAIVGSGVLQGSSFVAVQLWRHRFDLFDAMSAAEQDDAIGRRRSDNQELDDAPPSAHVKRTAQESFEPAAFVLRRSMPWADGDRAGLVFVAFGASLDAYEAQMRRMAGLDDGIEDALFRFTLPVSGAYYWCPAMAGGRLDLRPLGL